MASSGGTYGNPEEVRKQQTIGHFGIEDDVAMLAQHFVWRTSRVYNIVFWGACTLKIRLVD